jgi:hypothetical protein
LSPISGRPNEQITYGELDGIKWFFSNRDTSVLVKDIPGIRQYRFADALYGREIRKPNIRYSWVLTQKPDHFGYGQTNYLGEYYGVIGDVNDDGAIDFSDYYLVKAHWFGHPDWDVIPDGLIDTVDLLAIMFFLNQQGEPNWIRADINRDGIVDVHDGILVMEHLNESYSDPWEFMHTLTPLSRHEFLRRSDVDEDLIRTKTVTLRDISLLERYLNGGNDTYSFHDRYFLVNKLGRELYPKLFPDLEEYWRYNPSDFYKLEQDITVSKVYSGGDLDIYLSTDTL